MFIILYFTLYLVKIRRNCGISKCFTLYLVMYSRVQGCINLSRLLKAIIYTFTGIGIYIQSTYNLIHTPTDKYQACKGIEFFFHKICVSYTFIFAFQCQWPLIFQTLKYKRLTPSGCKDIAIWKSEFVAKTLLLWGTHAELEHVKLNI